MLLLSQASQPSTITLENASTVCGILESGFTILAILCGGLWAYNRFDRERGRFPKANVRHSVQFQTIDEQQFGRVEIVIENVGNVLLKFSEIILWIQKIRPYDSAVLETIQSPLNDSDSFEADWHVIYDRELKNLGIELEPGETELFPFDVFFDEPIEAVQVYSHVENASKHGIGWNMTTIHCVPSAPTGSKTEAAGDDEMAVKKKQGHPKPRPGSKPRRNAPSSPPITPQGPKKEKPPKAPPPPRM